MSDRQAQLDLRGAQELFKPLIPSEDVTIEILILQITVAPNCSGSLDVRATEARRHGEILLNAL